MAKSYGSNGDLIPLKKLYKNAVKYVVENRVTPISEMKFKIVGDHGVHILERKDARWSCDCDLFHGRGVFRPKGQN
jgi:hypothetical protein